MGDVLVARPARGASLQRDPDGRIATGVVAALDQVPGVPLDADPSHLAAVALLVLERDAALAAARAEVDEVDRTSD